MFLPDWVQCREMGQQQIQDKHLSRGGGYEFILVLTWFYQLGSEEIGEKRTLCVYEILLWYIWRQSDEGKSESLET